MGKTNLELKNISDVKKYTYILTLLIFAVGCLAPENNYFNQALNQAAGGNEIRYTPTVLTIKLREELFALTGRTWIKSLPFN